MNAQSSRSHSIFTLLVEQKRICDDGGEVTLRSKFNLVDLAGSEKWDVRQAMGDARVAEMTKINLSLHTLGRCIAALSKRGKQQRGGGGRKTPTDPGCMYVTRARLHLSSTNSNLYIHAHTLGLAPLHHAMIRAKNRSQTTHTYSDRRDVCLVGLATAARGRARPKGLHHQKTDRWGRRTAAVRRTSQGAHA